MDLGHDHGGSICVGDATALAQYVKHWEIRCGLTIGHAMPLVVLHGLPRQGLAEFCQQA
jgi:hypothetical protein